MGFSQFIRRIFGTNPLPANAISFVLIDETGKQDRAWLAKVCVALTKQATNDFDMPPPLGYGVSARVRLGVSAADAKPGEWLMVLLPKPDQPDALGFHDKDAAGNPIIKVFPSLMGGSKDELSSCLSHELLETLADPEGITAVQGPDGKMWALEVADGIEQDTYRIDGIAMSNFATWAYWGGTNSKRFDFMGLCTKPLETRPGGYNQFFGSNGWTQVTHATRPPSAYRRALAALGRGAKRKALPISAS